MLRYTRPSLLKAAVVLSGNGVYDGTETTEGVALLVALSRHGADVTVYAPDKPQAHVVDHMSGEEAKESRNVKVESARIARGQVTDLKELKASEHDALFVPGGFGAAKNLSDFGFKGAEMKVDSRMEEVIKDFHAAKKCMGFCCISPILLAKVLGPGAKITLGGRGDAWPFQGSIDAATSFGVEHAETDTVANTVCVDETNKLVTAPAYMMGTAAPHHVFDNVSRMVDTTVKMI